LFFFISVGSTEVRYGVNDVEVGVFFSGIQTSSALWALLDLYGSTVAVEFIGKYVILYASNCYDLTFGSQGIIKSETLQSSLSHYHCQHSIDLFSWF